MSSGGEASTLTIPEGFTLHTENTSHILIQSKDEAFLNPVQEFNRDLSVACIRVWSEERDKIQREKWKRLQEKRSRRELASEPKRAKVQIDVEDADMNEPPASMCEPASEVTSDGSTAKTSPSGKHEYRPYKFVLLEPLSATGLRSIRYAKEIPFVRFIIANDISPSAIAAMNRNISINGLDVSSTATDEDGSEEQASSRPRLGKVRVSEGDACALMYNHRTEKTRVDVVDLDPYGTAAPFIDAAVQCVHDGGLLCVTCTDLSVLATTNYPEKCYSNYGGVPVKAEYCHEAALRLVLHSISTSAGRYGRYMEPLLSLSIDFYVRIFVQIHSAPIEVKKSASKTSIYYICSSCQSFYGQPLGRITTKVHESSGNVNYHFKTQTGPPISEKCPECDSPLHIAGPMWAGPIRDSDFVSKVLLHLEENKEKYGTSTRMRGMLTVAKEELDTPFYFTPSKIAGFFHSNCPALDEVASALLNAGHQVSRSHACPGSLKTTATRVDIHDIFRSWIKEHPVRMDKIADHSPARRLLAKEPRTEANFKHHPQSVSQSSTVKLVRYQQNPTANWGPGKKADDGMKRKRKDDNDE